MKQSILEKIKKECLMRKELKKKYNNDDIRIKELEEKDNVKEYLDLLSKKKDRIKIIDSLDLSNEDDLIRMYMSLFSIHRSEICETNNIYVYLGSYQKNYETDIEHGASDYSLKKDDPNVDYSVYKNLETEEEKIILINEKDEFEREHNIINLKGFFKENRFYTLQSEFIKNCIENSQEEAVKKVLTLNNK